MMEVMFNLLSYLCFEIFKHGMSTIDSKISIYEHNTWLHDKFTKPFVSYVSSLLWFLKIILPWEQFMFV